MVILSTERHIVAFMDANEGVWVGEVCKNEASALVWLARRLHTVAEPHKDLYPEDVVTLERLSQGVTTQEDYDALMKLVDEYCDDFMLIPTYEKDFEA